WVVGKYDGHSREELKNPQLWVEKDSFLPLRLVFPRRAGLTDVRVESIRHTREFPYPRVFIASDPSGAPFLREEVSDVLVNPAANEQKGWPQTDKAAGGWVAGADPAGPVRELIEAYFQRMR